MKRQALQIILTFLIISCQAQETIPLNSIASINGEGSNESISFSNNKLFTLSRNGVLSTVDLNNYKVRQILSLKNLGYGSVTPSSWSAFNDSIIFIYRNRIVHGSMEEPLNFRTIKNKGIVQGMRYKFNSLVLCYREKVRIVNLKGNITDSVITNLNFDVPQGIMSPYLKFYLSSQDKIWVPYNNRDAKNISVDLKNRLDKFNTKLYPADLYKDYIPKTVSEKCIYWQNSKEPHLFIVSSTVDFSKHKVIELDKRQINYQNMSPETIQLSEGDEGIPDLENAVKLANDNNGTVFIMFQSKDNLTKIFSFKLNEDEFK